MYINYLTYPHSEQNDGAHYAQYSVLPANSLHVVKNLIVVVHNASMSLRMIHVSW